MATRASIEELTQVPEIVDEKPAESALATPMPRIAKSTAAGIISNFTQVATRLITIPVVIHHLGLDSYGIWNIIVTAATYLRFGVIGIKTAFQKYVAEATGTGDYRKASELLSTGCAITLGLSVLTTTIGSLFARRIAQAMGVPAPFLDSAATSILVLALIGGTANIGATFEAIVLGGHRIDLVRKAATILSIAEAVLIVAALQLGLGLVAMATVMGVSELVFVTWCYWTAKRVVPQIKIEVGAVTPRVIRELVRFAGSYQCVNLLEVLYVSLVPVAVLKNFGAQVAGVYALIVRIVTAAGALQEPVLAPVLSGAAMVYAKGSAREIGELCNKAFRLMLGLSVLPFGFVAVFGATVAYAWTGTPISSYGTAVWWICLMSLFQALSLLALVLYRASGHALMDNVRQLIRLAARLLLVYFAGTLGFPGLLAGTAFTEFAGLAFMVYVLTQTFAGLRTRKLVADGLRLASSAAIILGAGLLASRLIPGSAADRMSAMYRLAAVSLACGIAAYPAMIWTGSITSSERAKLAGFLRRWTWAPKTV